MDEEGRGFESRRGLIQDFVIFCRDDIVEKRLLRDRKTGTAIELRDRKPGLLETTSATETRQEAIRINLLQVELAPSTIICVH